MGRAENPGCGDLVEMTVRLEGDVLAEVGFLAQGCVPTIAAASRLTELAKGATVAQALWIEPAELARSLGGLPGAGRHAAALAVQALRAAVEAARGARSAER